MEPILRSVNLSKSFGSLPVLQQVSFAVAPGEVVGLAAGHGGGKSVLASILAGALAPTEGEVYIHGRRMRWPYSAGSVGVQVVHQETELIEQFDITANIFLGDEMGSRRGGVLRMLDEARMTRRAAEALALLDADLGPLHTPAVSLSSEQRQILGLARALIHPAQLVVVDEPALPLSYAFQQKLLWVVRNWQRQGAAVLFMSNNLDHLFAVADRMIVLRLGRCVADVPTAATNREAVVAALVGTTDRQQLTPIIWALNSYYRAREEAENLGQRQTLLEQNLAEQIAALDSANAALQDAHRRLLTEREEERKALARELHDQVIQDLLSMNYQLEEAQAETHGPGSETTGDLAEVRAGIRGLVDDLRQICSNLRPPTIDSMGLGAALQSYTRDWSLRSGIRVRLDLDQQLGRLPEPLELSIFRIVQEALSNVRKHAEATEVRLSLHRSAPGTLTLSIADNGHGLPHDFDLAALADAGHYGVLGISERLALVEGRLRLENAPGGGAALHAEIPAPKTRARAARVAHYESRIE